MKKDEYFISLFFLLQTNSQAEPFEYLSCFSHKVLFPTELHAVLCWDGQRKWSAQRERG